MFINFKNNQINVNSYRNPTATVCDLEGILYAIEDDMGEDLTCDADDAIDALKDEEFLETLVDVSQETIENLHYELKEVTI